MKELRLKPIKRKVKKYKRIKFRIFTQIKKFNRKNKLRVGQKRRYSQYNDTSWSLIGDFYEANHKCYMD